LVGKVSPKKSKKKEESSMTRTWLHGKFYHARDSAGLTSVNLLTVKPSGSSSLMDSLHMDKDNNKQREDKGS
jgi:hypothetical protein